MGAGHLRLAVVLGLLALAGPFAIDMYLPAMPEMARDLNRSEAAVQVTLMAFFIPFGVAQMVYGPLADQIGRRAPIYFGMGLFGVASLGAATAETLEALVGWRALQGAGGAVAMVVPRAVIRDVETGPAATRLMALIMLVISVSPMLAPLAGSGVIAVAGWRAVFVFIAAMAVASLFLTAFLLPETLAPEDRVRVNLSNMRRGMARLLADGRFLGLTLIGSLGTASFFIFIASAPFIYTSVYGLSPTGFALAFAANAVGFFTASQLAGPMGERLGMDRTIRIGGGIFAGFAALLLLLALTMELPFWLLVTLLFLGNAGLGLVIPTVMVMALDDHGPIAGLASSLGGTIQMTLGGMAIALAGPFFDGTVLPLVASVALCAGLALVATIATLRPRAVARRT